MKVPPVCTVAYKNNGHATRAVTESRMPCRVNIAHPSFMYVSRQWEPAIHRFCLHFHKRHAQASPSLLPIRSPGNQAFVMASRVSRGRQINTMTGACGAQNLQGMKLDPLHYLHAHQCHVSAEARSALPDTICRGKSNSLSTLYHKQCHSLFFINAS